MGKSGSYCCQCYHMKSEEMKANAKKKVQDIHHGLRDPIVCKKCWGDVGYDHH